MSAPSYTIEYWGEQIHAIEFTPRLSTSDGHFNGILGKALIERFEIPHWTLTPTGAMRYTVSNDPQDIIEASKVNFLVEEAQDQIEWLMDQAINLNNFLVAIKESREKAGTV